MCVCHVYLINYLLTTYLLIVTAGPATTGKVGMADLTCFPDNVHMPMRIVCINFVCLFLLLLLSIILAAVGLFNCSAIRGRKDVHYTCLLCPVQYIPM